MALPANCPLCKAERDRQNVVTPHVYGGTEHQAFFHCVSCDVRYLYPGLSAEDEAHFYAAEFEGFMSGRSGSRGGWEQAERHVSANEPTRLRRMKYLEQSLPKKGRILEVGCSSGFMLYPLAQAGYACTGIEPSGVFREFVGSRGVPCLSSTGDLQQTLDSGGKFDAIMHFFVLEHIADPQAFLMQQLDLLNPGGVVIFEIPNAADPLHSVYNIPAFERFYWSVAHHWYFSRDSLAYLLGKLGASFEILLDQRYDLSNHMTWARDGRPGGMGKFTPQLGQELEDQYRQALVRVGRCDTLVGILKKSGE